MWDISPAEPPQAQAPPNTVDLNPRSETNTVDLKPRSEDNTVDLELRSEDNTFSLPKRILLGQILLGTSFSCSVSDFLNFGELGVADCLTLSFKPSSEYFFKS